MTSTLSRGIVTPPAGANIVADVRKGIRPPTEEETTTAAAVARRIKTITHGKGSLKKSASGLFKSYSSKNLLQEAAALEADEEADEEADGEADEEETTTTTAEVVLRVHPVR